MRLADCSKQKRSRFCRTRCRWVCASWSAESKSSDRKQVCTARENSPHLSMVQISSTGQPEQATISALVDTTDRNLDRDPNFPVKSDVGSPLRQTKTLHSESPFENLTDMSLLIPARSYSSPKHCVAAICSAMSSMAQVKKIC